MEKIISNIQKYLNNSDIPSIRNALDEYDKKYSVRKYYSIPIVHKNYKDISGLYYIENYLANSEINNLKEILNSIKFVLITSSKNSRRVAQFGYNYSYDRSGLVQADPIPKGLQELATCEKINKTLKEILLKDAFDQLIINEYKPKQQIAYHTDHTMQFGSIIACITIGQEAEINFKKNNEIISISPKEGSLYIMTGDARYIWKHSLRNNGSDNRYSLTYRCIIKF